MANPIVFPSKTNNFSLPLLFVGQAQKEPFINQAMSMIDAILIGTVSDSISTPPSSPQEGSSYRILAGADGPWTGHDDEIALWLGEAWVFILPSDGLTIFDKNARVQLRYGSGWETAIEPVLPTGGTTIDTQARTAISDIVDALRAAGVLPNSA